MGLNRREDERAYKGKSKKDLTKKGKEALARYLASGPGDDVAHDLFADILDE